MKYKYKVKWCPVCEQGWIEIVKDKITGKLFLCCSDCETEWRDPLEIKKDNGTWGSFGMIEEPSDEEILKEGWQKYIIES